MDHWDRIFKDSDKAIDLIQELDKKREYEFLKMVLKDPQSNRGYDPKLLESLR